MNNLEDFQTPKKSERKVEQDDDKTGEKEGGEGSRSSQRKFTSRLQKPTASSKARYRSPTLRYNESPGTMKSPIDSSNRGAERSRLYSPGDNSSITPRVPTQFEPFKLSVSNRIQRTPQGPHLVPSTATPSKFRDHPIYSPEFSPLVTPVKTDTQPSTSPRSADPNAALFSTEVLKLPSLTDQRKAAQAPASPSTSPSTIDPTPASSTDVPTLPSPTDQPQEAAEPSTSKTLSPPGLVANSTMSSVEIHPTSSSSPRSLKLLQEFCDMLTQQGLEDAWKWAEGQLQNSTDVDFSVLPPLPELKTSPSLSSEDNIQESSRDTTDNCPGVDVSVQTEPDPPVKTSVTMTQTENECHVVDESIQTEFDPPEVQTSESMTQTEDETSGVDERPTNTEIQSANSSKVYLVVTEPHDLVGVDVARQLRELPDTGRIYLAFPPREEHNATRTLAKLRRSKSDDMFNVVWYDSAMPATKTRLTQDADRLVRSIQKAVGRLDGVMLNSHGTGNLERGEDPGEPRKYSGLIPMAEKKLFGNIILMDKLLESNLLQTDSRVVVAGTEAARGLPKMGFPVPDKLQPSKELMEQFLSGSFYDKPFQYQQAYPYVGAILALYVAELAKRYPNIFFSTVSPGMTQESLKASHLPHPTLLDKFQMSFFRVVLFPMVLKRSNIAHDYTVGASYFVNALCGSGEWGPNSDYANGVFVGALKGTSGPIVDQYQLPNGTIFRDEALQEASYEAVRKHIDMGDDERSSGGLGVSKPAPSAVSVAMDADHSGDSSDVAAFFLVRIFKFFLWVFVGFPLHVIKTAVTWIITSCVVAILYMYVLEAAEYSLQTSPPGLYFANNSPGIM